MSVKLFNPDYLLSLCRNYNLQPSSHYGQNFLIHPVKSRGAGIPTESGLFNGVNPEPLDKMLEAAELSPNDTVVEVGPGFGVLTFALAAKAKKVLAFEIEKKIAGYWQTHKPENVEVIWGNILKEFGVWDLPTRTTDVVQSGGGLGVYKVVANLPYQITSPVIRFFLEAENPPELMVLMVQKEVAERICAKAGDMSVLAVAVQYYAEAEIITQVPRSYFWPVPRVDSAVIRLTIHPVKCSDQVGTPPEAGFNGVNKEQDKNWFFRVVKMGFANRRKMLIKNLESIVGKKNRSKLEQIFTELNLNPKVRAQELSVEDWRVLTERIEKLENPKPQ